MKVKFFKIRLSDEFIYSDQKALDRFLAGHSILKYESAFVKEEESYWSVIIYYEDLKLVLNEEKTEKYTAEDDTALSPDEIRILESLKIWRTEKAKDQSLPVYFIATNKELLSIARYRPGKKEELLGIKGFGKHKIENYGEEIIEILETV